MGDGEGRRATIRKGMIEALPRPFEPSTVRTSRPAETNSFADQGLIEGCPGRSRGAKNNESEMKEIKEIVKPWVGNLKQTEGPDEILDILKKWAEKPENRENGDKIMAVALFQIIAQCKDGSKFDNEVFNRLIETAKDNSQLKENEGMRSKMFNDINAAAQIKKFQKIDKDFNVVPNPPQENKLELPTRIPESGTRNFELTNQNEQRENASEQMHQFAAAEIQTTFEEGKNLSSDSLGPIKRWLDQMGEVTYSNAQWFYQIIMGANTKKNNYFEAQTANVQSRPESIPEEMAIQTNEQMIPAMKTEIPIQPKGEISIDNVWPNTETELRGKLYQNTIQETWSETPGVQMQIGVHKISENEPRVDKGKTERRLPTQKEPENKEKNKPITNNPFPVPNAGKRQISKVKKQTDDEESDSKPVGVKTVTKGQTKSVQTNLRNPNNNPNPLHCGKKQGGRKLKDRKPLDKKEAQKADEKPTVPDSKTNKNERTLKLIKNTNPKIQMSNVLAKAKRPERYINNKKIKTKSRIPKEIKRGRKTIPIPKSAISGAEIKPLGIIKSKTANDKPAASLKNKLARVKTPMKSWSSKDKKKAHKKALMELLLKRFFQKGKRVRGLRPS